MNAKLAALVGAFVVLGPLQARAAIVFDLNPPAQTGSPGDTLVFNATLTNTGPSTVYLNGDAFDAPCAGFSVDDSPYVNSFPVSLASGQSFTGDLFKVNIGPGVAGGVYTGSFTLIGGADGNAQDNLGTDYFDVTVAVNPSLTPEPGTVALLVSGGLTGGASLMRRRRR